MPLGSKKSTAPMQAGNKPRRDGLSTGPAKSLPPTSGSETEAFMKMRSEKRRNTTNKGVKS